MGLSGEKAALPDLGISPAYHVIAKVLEAFSLACHVKDLDTAQAMLKVAESIVERDGVQAFAQWGLAQTLVDAHFRLWEMRHAGG